MYLPVCKIPFNLILSFKIYKEEICLEISYIFTIKMINLFDKES
jgi:hypothetical protein